MGVPSFYKWLSSKYPLILADVVEDEVMDEDGNAVVVDTSQPNPNGLECVPPSLAASRRRRNRRRRDSKLQRPSLPSEAAAAAAAAATRAPPGLTTCTWI